MASSKSSFYSPMFATVVSTALLVIFLGGSNAQLSPNFYATSCPNVLNTVKSVVQSAISRETRMGASLLRLHFHDCFVNGCDGSILLDDTSNFTGEKNANANSNSARGFEVIDNIKTAVERVCPGVVSCADIVAIAARDSVGILGGPTWNVKLGRRDARTASQAAANRDIPPPSLNLAQLTSNFAAQGLSQSDMVALSGGHTIGFARCISFRPHIYNDANIDRNFSMIRQGSCPGRRAQGTTAWHLLTSKLQQGLTTSTMRISSPSKASYTPTRNCTEVAQARPMHK
ncbi:hypothetical protein Scep_005822 [Stephania cephalantha]|uniref:Peroxidase n=1 Tax=Stephania cephalantha TaxID=152367 RepID=A0AAP0PWR9_9MAGN